MGDKTIKPMPKAKDPININVAKVGGDVKIKAKNKGDGGQIKIKK